MKSPTIFLLIISRYRALALSLNNQQSCSHPVSLCALRSVSATRPGLRHAAIPYKWKWCILFFRHRRLASHFPLPLLSCAQLHKFVHVCAHARTKGAGNDCWQDNRSMRMQYKSLIMPESWIEALQSTRHSSQPEEPFHWWFFFHCVTAGRSRGSRGRTRHSSSGTFLSKSTFINEIKHCSAEIIISLRRSSQFLPVIPNYKVK